MLGFRLWTDAVNFDSAITKTRKMYFQNNEPDYKIVVKFWKDSAAEIGFNEKQLEGRLV